MPPECVALFSPFLRALDRLVSLQPSFTTEYGAVSEPEVPPLPTRSPRRPRTAALKPIILPDDLRERKTSLRERAWSSIHVREVAGDAGRGRQTKSEGGGSVKAVSATEISSCLCSSWLISCKKVQVASPRHEPSKKCFSHHVVL